MIASDPPPNDERRGDSVHNRLSNDRNQNAAPTEVSSRATFTKLGNLSIGSATPERRKKLGMIGGKRTQTEVTAPKAAGGPDEPKSSTTDSLDLNVQRFGRTSNEFTAVPTKMADSEHDLANRATPPPTTTAIDTSTTGGEIGDVNWQDKAKQRREESQHGPTSSSHLPKKKRRF